MPNQIVLASNNEGKRQELNQLLSPLNCHLNSMQSFSITSPDETGLTFVENALIKARHSAKHSKLSAIADDSGLVVPVLEGQPGLYSSRFAGNHATDEQNYLKLIEMLEKYDEPDAYFYCVIVYIRHELDPCPIICHGEFWGKILKTPRGHNGFGYDPIFLVPTLNKTSAELAQDVKNKISHRALACQQLVEALQQEFQVSA